MASPLQPTFLFFCEYYPVADNDLILTDSQMMLPTAGLLPLQVEATRTFSSR